VGEAKAPLQPLIPAKPPQNSIWPLVRKRKLARQPVVVEALPPPLLMAKRGVPVMKESAAWMESSLSKSVDVKSVGSRSWP